MLQVLVRADDVNIADSEPEMNGRFTAHIVTCFFPPFVNQQRFNDDWHRPVTFANPVVISLIPGPI
jgi:hypothetical protein